LHGIYSLGCWEFSRATLGRVEHWLAQDTWTWSVIEKWERGIAMRVTRRTRLKLPAHSFGLWFCSGQIELCYILLKLMSRCPGKILQFFRCRSFTTISIRNHLSQIRFVYDHFSSPFFFLLCTICCIFAVIFFTTHALKVNNGIWIFQIYLIDYELY
jgi:hypothetical protein